ncbi:MAG: TlpA disulfide reductase family protein, partial [Saprospiraceae bacterium]|nr:TlpA disulfide reductase family protein [Saprospiraceae bacterium]
MSIIIGLLLSLTFAPYFPEVSSAENDEIDVVDFKGLQKYLDQYGDKTLVINFWATWCVPCVKELPYFEKATDYYTDEDVEVILVSLDFSRQIDTRLKPF